MSLRTSIGAAWTGQGPPWLRGALGALAPASWAYRAVVGVRNGWYDRRPAGPPPIPTIAVGNLTVGGTGKTPVLRALAAWCASQGRTAAVVTRGYGADEVGLYRRWLGPDRVFITPRRREGIQRAAAAGLDAALVDDGFQHRQAPRSLDILLVSSDAPYPPRLLPWGPYREPLNAARRADLVVVTERTGGAASDPWLHRLREVAPHVPATTLSLGATGWYRLGAGSGPSHGAQALGTEPGRCPEGPALAVASIADPLGFERLLRGICPDLEVELAPFPDHFEYNPTDAEKLARRAGSRPIVTTEKDAEKLDGFEALRERTWVVAFGVDAPLPDALTERLGAIFEDRST